jgi:hypothetical protein
MGSKKRAGIPLENEKKRAAWQQQHRAATREKKMGRDSPSNLDLSTLSRQQQHGTNSSHRTHKEKFHGRTRQGQNRA